MLNELFNIRALPVAAGRELGQIKIPALDYTTENNFGGLSLGGELGVNATLITIDSLKLSKLRLLKVDAEGMEYDVLAGAAETIRQLQPVLYVENDRQDRSPQLISLIMGLGYQLWWHLIPLFNPNNFNGQTDNIFTGLGSMNMLCLPAGMRAKTDGMKPITSPHDWWK
jgi:hypothetical protein